MPVGKRSGSWLSLSRECKGCMCFVCNPIRTTLSAKAEDYRALRRRQWPDQAAARMGAANLRPMSSIDAPGMPAASNCSTPPIVGSGKPSSSLANVERPTLSFFHGAVPSRPTTRWMPLSISLVPRLEKVSLPVSSFSPLRVRISRLPVSSSMCTPRLNVVESSAR